MRRNGTRLFMSSKRTLLLCHPSQNVLLVKGWGGKSCPLVNPARWMKPVKLQRAYWIAAWDRQEVIGCCSAAISCIWSSSQCSQSVVCIFHSYASFLYSFLFFKFIPQFINICCPLVLLLLFLMSDMAGFGLGIKISSVVNSRFWSLVRFSNSTA